MKKILLLLMCGLLLFGCGDKCDDSALRNDLDNLANRVAKLEELCKQMNTNISSLQTIVNTLQNNDYVTSVTPVMQNGKEVGYTITFSKGKPITIYHGKDGLDGEDGTTPSIGVKQDTDGVYYWTLNGEWLTDIQGNKIKSEGKDGTSGVTPKFKIESDYWYISYDNEKTWTQLGKSTGEDGMGGDSMFTDVDYKTNTEYVIFTLADGTQIKLPTWSAFEALRTLCNQTNTNLISLQAIVSALQNNDYITSVDPLTENGKVIGYTIKFAKSNPIVIYNGKDGVNGTSPVVGVKKYTDGIYYWTLDGEFIVVDGAKLKAQGTDGGNGSDGITPKFKIENGYWHISYDNGTNWTQLGKATGDNGQDGNSVIKSVTQDETNVYITLADGTVITIPKSGQVVDPNNIQFEDENVKKLCVAVWDTDGDHELSYEEAAAVTTINKTFMDNTTIQLFNELKYFTGLTALNESAFRSCTNLWNVTIPKKVATINRMAFRGCSQLKRVVFEKDSQLKAIKGGYNDEFENSFSYGAFSDCTSLLSIEIPASVETIGVAAFRGCSNLATVTFEKGSQLKTIEGGYDYDGNYYYFYGAFSHCTSLLSIEIPASVETIGIVAFRGCSNLATVTFEKGSQLKTIEGGSSYAGDSHYDYYGAFSKLANLMAVDMSACTQVKTIGESAFYDCSKLNLFKIGTIVPPICKNVAFGGINPYSVLKVPSGCADAYKKASEWKQFASITGLDE